jgi:hypothetical protein
MRKAVMLLALLVLPAALLQALALPYYYNLTWVSFRAAAARRRGISWRGFAAFVRNDSTRQVSG